MTYEDAVQYLNDSNSGRVVWDDTKRAEANNALGGGGGGGDIPAFEFDYANEATKAYGELGTYYNRLLTESQGDTNLALARMVEDYDKGLRIKTEDTALARQRNEEAKALAERRAMQSALSRGLYQKSMYGEGYGIPDAEKVLAQKPYEQQATDLTTGLSRYQEEAGITKKRTEYDLPLKQKRYEAELEQQRRKESAELANTRGDRAFREYQAKYALG